MILAVIPARGGSKRIRGKNIRPFCGQPIIKYSIDAALESGVFDRVIVSTDCEEIAAVARQCKAEVPFERPAELSDDHTPTVPVVRHAVEWMSDHEAPVEHACCIYATAPFVRADDLRAGFEALRQDSSADFAFPVTTFAFPIFRSLKLNEGRVEMFYPEHETTRSQDLPEAWHDAGQFYWGTRSAWKGDRGIFTAASIGLPIERHRVQDIDTEEDWTRAELMYQSQVAPKASSSCC
jgi:N-acylneuraminate cytidylyltransferase